MDKKIRLVYAALVVIVLFGIYMVLNSPGVDFSENNSNAPTPVGCTMEAKMCPDGSYVGRTGPKCEFKKCPEDIHGGQLIGQATIFSGLKITPIEIVEDSRCPEGTQCIWAGRVIIKTKFDFGDNKTMETDVEAGKPVDAFGFRVTLYNVMPSKKIDSIKPEDYTLLYSVKFIKL